MCVEVFAMRCLLNGVACRVLYVYWLLLVVCGCLMRIGCGLLV